MFILHSYNFFDGISMKKYILSVGFILIGLVSQSQIFSVSAGGNWNVGTTWVGGVVPTATDMAIIMGDGAGGGTVNITSDVEVGDLYVVNDNTNVLSKGGLLFATYTLTIHGQLSGILFDLSNFAAPTTTVIENDTRLNIVFTNNNSNTPNITIWGQVATLRNVSVNPSSAATTVIFEDLAINASTISVDNGTLRISNGFQLADATSSSTLTVAAGSTLDIEGSVDGGAASTNFNTVETVGTGIITVNINGYLNSNAITLSSGGTLNVTNNQPNGWWHSTSSGPSSGTIDANSTVNYNRQSAQGVAARTYGNLNISSSGVAATKTLSGSGTLTVQGNLSIGGSNTFASSNSNTITVQGTTTNDGIWTVSQPIQFNGSSAQAIGGGSAITFNDNVIFANSAGVDFNVDVTFASTITDNNNPITFTQDFTFSGTTYDQGSGIITFDGNSQQIAGAGDINFNNVTLTNATLANNATNASLSGLLSMSNSSFDADGSGSGSFTLVSDANGTASVGNLTGSTVSGNWTVQRYFDGSGDVWRNFGVAVTGSTVSGDIAGSGFTINGNDLAHYDETETALGTVNDGWVLQSTFGNSLSNSRGYSMWTRDTEITNTVDFTGTLNTGNRNMTVSRTTGPISVNDDGWNLVNNPYASTVDWDLMSRSNLNGTVSVWNTATSAYDTWNGSTGGLSNGLIASGQSFWVHSTSGTPTLTITEADKSTSSTSFLKVSPLTNHLIIKLIQDEKIDKAYIHFREDATDDFDNDFDGLKQKNGIYNLSSLAASGESLSINSLSLISCEKTIKLNITNISEGTYQLEFNDIESFETAFKFTLIDNFLSTSTTIEEGVLHNFDITADTASYGNARFEIRLTTATLDTNVSYEITDACEISSLTITNAQKGVEYTLLQNAESILTKKATSSTLVIPLEGDLLVEGLNKFDLSLSNGGCSSPELITDAIEFTVNALQEISAVTDGESCGNGQVLLSASGALGNSYYNWYESFDSNSPIPNQNSNEFLTPALESSKFYYVSIINEAGCESSARVKVAASIKTPPSTDILYLEANPCDLASNITITNAEIGATYNLMQNGQIIITEEATSNQLILPLNQQQINVGINKFDLMVESDGCSSELLNAIEFEYFSIKEIASVTNGKICTSGSVVLIAEGASNDEHYNWYETLDAVEPIAGENANEFVSPELDESKSYFVSIVNANGCESVSRVEVVAEIVNLEQPDILYVEEEAVISTDVVVDGYQWYKDEVQIEDATGQSINIVESGTYKLEITSNGCTSFSVNQTVTILGLEDLRKIGIGVYPNPVIDVLNIKSSKAKINSVIIYDTKGVAVFRSGKTIPSEINLTSIKKGIYIINIVTDNKSINYRFRKQ